MELYFYEKTRFLNFTEDSANFSEFFSAPYRTATDRLSFWKITHHINGFSVKNAI